MSFGHQFCQREGIMAEHIDMSVAKRGEACDIFIIQCFTLRPEMIQGCLHINSVALLQIVGGDKLIIPFC